MGLEGRSVSIRAELRYLAAKVWVYIELIVDFNRDDQHRHLVMHCVIFGYYSLKSCYGSLML